MFKLKDVEIVDVNSIGTVEVTQGGSCPTCEYTDIELRLGIKISYSDGDTETIIIKTEDVYDEETLSISIIQLINIITSPDLIARMPQMTRVDFNREIYEKILQSLRG